MVKRRRLGVVCLPSRVTLSVRHTRVARRLDRSSPVIGFSQAISSSISSERGMLAKAAAPLGELFLEVCFLDEQAWLSWLE